MRRSGGARKNNRFLAGRDASWPKSGRRISHEDKAFGSIAAFRCAHFYAQIAKERNKMAEERIGFVGIVIEDLSQAARVNQVVGQYQSLVTGRIGVPDHERNLAVIGLLVRGEDTQLGAFTGRLGNIPGVQVKSAMTKTKTEKKEGNFHEKDD